MTTTKDPRHKAFIDAYCTAYQEKNGCAYLFTGKDAKMVQTLLKGLPNDTVDDLMRVVRSAWISHDPFLRKAANSLPMLVSQWNQIRAQMPKRLEEGF